MMGSSRFINQRWPTMKTLVPSLLSHCIVKHLESNRVRGSGGCGGESIVREKDLRQFSFKGEKNKIVFFFFVGKSGGGGSKT